MKLSFSLLLSLCFFSLSAQNVLNETLKQQMIKDWERAKAYTQEYLEAMPADKYSFRPIDGVRSFAEQMLHFAQADVRMASAGTGFKNPAVQNFFTPSLEKSRTAQNKDSVMYYVTTSYDFVINAVKAMNFDKSGEIVSFDMGAGNRSSTRLGWLMKAFEHQTHHRGQCTVYLRLAGIKPPAERLWD